MLDTVPEDELIVEHLGKRKKSKKDKKRKDKDRHRRSPIADEAPASPMQDDELDEEPFIDDTDRHYHQKRKAKYDDDEDQPRSSRRRRSFDGEEFLNGQTLDERRRDTIVGDDDEDDATNDEVVKHDKGRHNVLAVYPKTGGDDQAMSESELESRRAALLAQLNDSLMDE